MKIKITEPGYYVSNSARTATPHIKDYVYDISEEDAQRLVKDGVAELVDDDTPTGRPTPKPAPKKKTKKSKGKVEPPIPDGAPEAEKAEEGGDGEV